MQRMFLASACAIALFCSTASANEFADQLNALAKSEVAEFIKSSEVVEAIKAQNTETAGYDQVKIDALDKQWRAEVGAPDQPLISATLAKSASKFLQTIKEQGAGLYTEIFVMDAKGLNVAQSDATSDYWQGDEAKWQETFLKGKDGLHISDVEQDESTQTYQSQLSVSIVDPADGTVIGAVTVGVNVEMLQ